MQASGSSLRMRPRTVLPWGLGESFSAPRFQVVADRRGSERIRAQRSSDGAPPDDSH